MIELSKYINGIDDDLKFTKNNEVPIVLMFILI
jgi:hypothetical protein